MRVLGLTLFVVGVTACGGDDDASDAPSEPAAAGDDTSGSDSGEDGEGGNGAGSGGAVVSRQPAGQALVSVDGQEFTLTEPGALACTLTEDSITFSFRIGDNEVTLGAGANRTDDDWFGGVDVRVANPSGEDGPIAYFPELPANSSGMAVDGDSFSYSGPMLKQPPNDGSNPPPIDVGEGTISITCP
jgi:hypothetical protein